MIASAPHLIKPFTDGAQQRVQGGREASMRLAGGCHGPAALMAHHQDQGDVVGFDGVFKGGDRSSVASVPGIANDEEIPESRVEQQFDRDS